MPWASPPGPPPTFLQAAIPLYGADASDPGLVATDVLTLPGQVFLSLLLVAGAAYLLRRRGRIEAAAGWIAAWALGTAIEVVCKHAIARPPLYRHGVHVPSFDASWPSGHTLRTALVAGALGAALPRLRPLLALWWATVLVLLVVAGWHAPSDLAGGVLLALLLALGVRELEASALLRRRAALRRGGAARRTAP